MSIANLLLPPTAETPAEREPAGGPDRCGQELAPPDRSATAATATDAHTTTASKRGPTATTSKRGLTGNTSKRGLTATSSKRGLTADDAERKLRHTAILQEIGRRIRARRRTAGLSMRELGESIGVSSHQVHKYEAGEDRMSAGTLYLVSRTLGLQVGELLLGVEQALTPGAAMPLAASRPPEDAQTQERVALVEAFARITDRGLRRLLLNTVRRIADGDGEAEPQDSAGPG